MSTGASAPLANGDSVVPAESQRVADFLTKLLQIRDEVYAGKHPRIRLPPKVLEQVARRPSRTAPPARATTNGNTNGLSASQLFPPRPESSLQKIPSPHEFASPVAHAPRPFSAKSAPSGIDPVLLTKSDHLIRAELQLKRQQLERALKDQLDKRGRVSDEEREREILDVDNLLVQAHKLVKPISGLRISASNSEGDESFDENSYYSSKADSWSSDVDRNPNTGADAAGRLTQQGKPTANEAPLSVPKPAPSGPTGPPVIDLDDEPYEPADNIEEYEPEVAGVHDEAEESDYSPPPADAGPSEPRRPNGRFGNGGLKGSSRRQSPTGPVPPIHNGRKRKREAIREEKKRQQASKRAIRSPEPLIKEEPQSPPPFAPYSNPPSSKRRALQPLPNDVAIASAREENRMQPVYYRDPEPAARLPRQYDEPLSPSVTRIPQRRLERDDQDLRRKASLQHARRPYSPINNDLYAAPEPRHVRAASQVFANRPIEQPIYREASARPSAAPRYLPESPGQEYLARAQSPTAMAPPPRRIVVDQYGNRYLAAPADEQELVAPSRRVEADPYHERAVTREPALRVPARAEFYEDGDVHRMPPPPRRYVEASEAEFIETRPYRREVSHRPVEVEYRPREMIERRPIAQYEEMGPPREYLPSRAYSVRPEVIRREVPEGYYRHESVQPGHVRVAAPRLREVSVTRHDAQDDRRFAFATPQRPFLDEGALGRPVEVVQERYATEAPRRTSYRY